MVGVGVLHGRRVVRIVFSVVQSHHGVVVHRIHVRQVPLVLLVSAAAGLPVIVPHEVPCSLATALLPIHPLVVPKLVDPSGRRSLPIVSLLRKIPFHSQLLLI